MNIFELRDKILQIERNTVNYSSLKNKLPELKEDINIKQKIFEENKLKLEILEKNSLTNSFKKITHSYNEELYTQKENLFRAKSDYECALIKYNQLISDISRLDERLNRLDTYLENYNEKFSIIKKQYALSAPYNSLYENLSEEKIKIEEIRSLINDTNNLEINFKNTIELIERAEVWGNFGGLVAVLDRELKMSKAGDSLKNIKIDLENIKSKLIKINKYINFKNSNNTDLLKSRAEVHNLNLTKTNENNENKKINKDIQCPINIVAEIILDDFLKISKISRFVVYDKIKLILEQVKLNLQETLMFKEELTNLFESQQKNIYKKERSIEYKIIDENLSK